MRIEEAVKFVGEYCDRHYFQEETCKDCRLKIDGECLITYDIGQWKSILIDETQRGGE